MKYRVTQRARRDLDEIWRYIATKSNIDTAEKVNLELHQAMKRLASMPGMGHEREEARGKPYRFLEGLLLSNRLSNRALDRHCDACCTRGAQLKVDSWK